MIPDLYSLSEWTIDRLWNSEEQRCSVCGDETTVQCRLTTNSARGINPFDVLLWHIKHASKHGLVLFWIQGITWLSKWRNRNSNTAQLLFAESRTTYWIPTGTGSLGTWTTMEVDSLLGHSTGSRCHSMAEAFSQEKAKAMINSLPRGLECIVSYDTWEDVNWWFITGQLARYMDDCKCRSPLIKRTLGFSMSTGNTKWWKDVTLAKTPWVLWWHVVRKTSQWSHKLSKLVTRHWNNSLTERMLPMLWLSDQENNAE